MMAGLWGSPMAGEFPVLTTAERKALELTGELANLVHHQVISGGPMHDHDWNEFAMRIHAVQHMIMAQAAARAYPDDFRLLGGTIGSASQPPGNPQSGRPS